MPASVLDELDGSRVLHALGALAVYLQDFVADLEQKKEARQGGKSGIQENNNRKKRGIVTGEGGEVKMGEKMRGDSREKRMRERKDEDRKHGG